MAEFESIADLDKRFGIFKDLPRAAVIGADINFVEYCIDKCATVYLIDIEQKIPAAVRALEKDNPNLRITPQNIRRIDPAVFKDDSLSAVVTTVPLNVDGAVAMVVPLKPYLKKDARILLCVDAYGWKEADLMRTARKMAELSGFTVEEYVRLHDNFYVLIKNRAPAKTLDIIVLTK
ncbi:MAG: hypothetical protein ABH829_04400 [archaeon]